jgi:hypothetical protein
VDEALAAAGAAPEVIVVGGADLFRALLPQVDRLYLTELDGAAEAQLGARDVFFPDISATAWREVYREHHPADDRHPFPFTWRILKEANRRVHECVSITLHVYITAGGQTLAVGRGVEGDDAGAVMLSVGRRPRRRGQLRRRRTRTLS